jgi:hypothetical protein
MQARLRPYWILIELAQIVKSQLSGDAREHPVVDESHRHQDRRDDVDRCRNAVARTDHDRRDNRRPAHQATDHGRLPVRAVLGRIHLVETDRARRALITATHERVRGERPQAISHRPGDDRPKNRPSGHCDRRRRLSRDRSRLPRSDALIDPIVVERLANVLDCTIRGGDAFRFAQYALVVVAERAREHLLSWSTATTSARWADDNTATTMQTIATATMTPIGTTTLSRAAHRKRANEPQPTRLKSLKASCRLAFSGRKLGTNTCYSLSFTNDSAQFGSGTCNSPGSVNWQ